jgi:hypothetical protein
MIISFALNQLSKAKISKKRFQWDLIIFCWMKILSLCPNMMMISKFPILIKKLMYYFFIKVKNAKSSQSRRGAFNG